MAQWRSGSALIAAALLAAAFCTFRRCILKPQFQDEIAAALKRHMVSGRREPPGNAVGPRGDAASSSEK